MRTLRYALLRKALRGQRDPDLIRTFRGAGYEIASNRDPAMRWSYALDLAALAHGASLPARLGPSPDPMAAAG